MKAHTTRLISAALLLWLAPVAAAQTAPGAPTPASPQPAPTAVPPVQPPAAPVAASLSLAQALGLLTQAPGWRGAALQYLSVSQNLDAARARAGLSLSAGAALNAVKVPIDGDWNAATTLSIQAAINVLPWSSSQLSVVQAMRGLYRAGLDQRDSQNTLVLSVVQQYLAARQATVTLSLAQQQQALAQRQLEVARAQQAGGVLTQENLLAAQASQEQAVSAVAEAGSTLDIALRQLYNTLGGVPPSVGSAGIPNFSSRPAAPAAPAPLETLLARAAQGRSEILKALSNQQDAQAALEAARLDRVLPDLSLSVQYGQLAATSSGTAGNTVSSSLNFKTGQLSAGASLPLNPKTTDSAGNPVTPPTSLALGLSGSFALLSPVADAATRSAQTSLDAAALSLANAQASVDLDVRQKYAAFQNALLALAAPRTSLTRTQTALASAQARLQAGLGTALEVQQAQLGTVQAQNTLDQAVNTAYLASLSLSVATAEFAPGLIAVPDALQPLPEPSSTASTGGQP